MKVAELRKLGQPALRKELEKVRRELFEAKYRLASNESKNTAVVKKLKKLVAQILTLMGESEENLEKTK